MKIGFIGAGRVGCALGKYLKEKGAGFSLTGYYSKSIASARGAAQFTDSHCYETSEAPSRRYGRDYADAKFRCGISCLSIAAVC